MIRPLGATALSSATRYSVLVLVLVLGCQRASDPPALTLLVSVDTLRADRIGAYGSQRGLTPNLDALAQESQVFERVFAPASLTLPSLSSVFTGLHPERTKIETNECILRAGIPTLAEMLRAAGYRTGAVVSSFILRRGTGLHRGFQLFDDHLDQFEAVRGIPERVAPATTRAALAMLDAMAEETSAPLFLWVHYQDPHGPYTPPDELLFPALARARAEPDIRRRLPKPRARGLGGIPPYQRLGNEQRPAIYRARYEAEIQYVDLALGALIEGLRERGRWPRTVLVFLSDHGEGLGEDDYWFAHGEYLSDPLVRVPLLMRVPGLAGARHEATASLQDILPTLGALLSVAVPADLPGRDLLAGDGKSSRVYMATLGGSSVPRFGLVQDGVKYLVTPERGRERLVTLSDEGHDLAESDPARLRKMREVLAGIRHDMEAAVPARNQTRTPQEIEHLRRLGYVE